MTTVSGLVVTPSLNGVSVGFTTGTTVRAQLQIGTASGTYPNKFTLEAVARTTHQLSGYGLTPATTYHYILQFYDHNGTLLDATADATFTTATAPTAGAAPGAIIGPLLGGTGVPSNSMGVDGNYYFRYDGGAGTHIYFKTAGAWAATAA